MNRSLSFLSRFCSKTIFLFASLFLLVGCQHNVVIINDVNEREANEIVVFLSSKGIAADKTATVSSAPGGAQAGQKYSISVDSARSTDAMAILNQNGLPRKKGTTLLDLFSNTGLMSSDKQESIRYQAGLAEQIANMIRKIDGVIDADVQLSFPTESSSIAIPGATPEAPKRITAAVYVKHQGVLDDPNSHLILKIKRLVSGSVAGLDVNDVTVISDRSRFTDITLTPSAEALEPKAKEYVSIWSIILSKNSASRFRMIFFVLVTAAVVFALAIAWLFWKFYPLLKSRGGFKSLLHPIPLQEKEEAPEEAPQSPEETEK